MNNTFTLVSLVSLSALFSIIGDTLGKQWAQTNKPIYFLAALMIFLFSGAFFLFALKYGKLGVISVAWDAITSLTLITIGYLVFKESLSLVQIIAVGLIFFAIFLLLKY